MQPDPKRRKHSIHQNTPVLQETKARRMPLSAWILLIEAAKLLKLHQRLLLPIISISLAFSSLLFLFNYLIISPLLLDLFVNLFAINSTSSDGLDHSSFQGTLNNDIKIIVITQSLLFSFSFIVYSLLTIAMIYAASLTHLGRHVTLVELISRLRRIYKGPMATQLLVSSLDLSYKLVSMALVGLSLYFIDGYKTMVSLAGFITLLALYFYVKLAIIWSLSSVVSVVEEGMHGMEAIARAEELVKVMRRQGIVITLLVVMASSVVFVIYALTLELTLLTSVSQLLIGLVMANACALVNLFSVVVYAVIYYECKKSCGDEEMAMKGKFVYDDDDDEDCVPTSTCERELLDFHD